MSDYNPRVAIITGAAQGLGYSIALQLACDGLDIAVNDVASKQDRVDEVVKEIQKLGRKAIAVLADVTSEEEVKGMIERVANELGSVDIVSNEQKKNYFPYHLISVKMIANAGIARLSLLIDSERYGIKCKYGILYFPVAQVEDLEAVLAVNVRGVFLCYKQAALQMIKEGHGGRIIGSAYAFSSCTS